MTKILIYIAAWKRARITRLCYEGVKRLQAYNPAKYKIDCLVIYSDPIDAALAKTYDFHVVEAPNHPLGAKFNAGLNPAMDLEWDYLLQLGSDDLLASVALDCYKHYFDKQIDIIGLTDLAFVNSETKQAKRFEYHTMIGGGRAIRRGAIEDSITHYDYRVKKSFSGPLIRGGAGEVLTLHSRYQKDGLFEIIPGSKKYQLWEPEIGKGLDFSSEKALKWKKRSIVGVGYTDPLLVDIKSKTNIHKYEAFEGPELNINDLLNFFPELRNL